MLNRIMPNIKGTENPKRKILATVVYSTLLYGEPAWGTVIKWRKYINILERVQRKIMLRLCRSNRTVATAALQIITGSLPIELMVEEKSRTYDIQKESENKEEVETRK